VLYRHKGKIRGDNQNIRRPHADRKAKQKGQTVKPDPSFLLLLLALYGAPGEIRTPDPQIRSPLKGYPQALDK